jgi:hypothetical protein
LTVQIVPIQQWRWMGQAGHFCAARHCRFHLHTHIGRFCVSTVGEYFPGDGEKMEPLSSDPANFYETAVFRLRLNGEVDCLTPIYERHNSKRSVAIRFHRTVCERMARRAQPK